MSGIEHQIRGNALANSEPLPKFMKMLRFSQGRELLSDVAAVEATVSLLAGGDFCALQNTEEMILSGN